MVDVTRMLNAHMIQQPTKSNVHARQAMFSITMLPMQSASILVMSTMAVVKSMLSAHMIPRPMLPNVRVKLATRMLVLNPMSSAKVNHLVHRRKFPSILLIGRSRLSFLDSCLVDNGGCHCDALCSHDPTTNAVVCTCKTGYTNTGSATNVTCTGNHEKHSY